MRKIAMKLKKEFEETNSQSLYNCHCNCGRFTTIVMSNYVHGSTLYAIVYCSRCNKFYYHSGGSTLQICGETTYSGHLHPLEYESDRWYEVVRKIKSGNIFA